MSKGILYATYIFEVFWLISLENTSIPAKSCLALKPSARESKCILHTSDDRVSYIQVRVILNIVRVRVK